MFVYLFICDRRSTNSDHIFYSEDIARRCTWNKPSAPLLDITFNLICVEVLLSTCSTAEWVQGGVPPTEQQ